MAARGSEFDWDNVRSDKAYNKGYYNAEIIEADIKHSTNGFKQYIFTCNLTEPVEFNGMPYYERITVGNEEDPDAEDPKTWATNFGCGRYKAFLKACGLTLKGWPDEMVKKTEGAKLCLKLGQKVQTKGEYAGEIQQTSQFYRVGERDPGLLADEGEPRRKRANGDARKVAADDDDEPETAPPTRRTRDDDDDEPPRRRVAR